MTDTKRQKLFRKCGGKCAYCGKPLNIAKMTADHVKPKTGGGTSEIKNLLPACHPCNTDKGAMTLEEYRMKVFWHKLKPADLFSFDTARTAIAQHLFYFEKTVKQEVKVKKNKQKKDKNKMDAE